MISDKLIKRLDPYDLIIFDMDGTLYFQRGMQIKMALSLIGNALLTEKGIKELRTVLAYRKEREGWDEALSLDEDELLRRVSKKVRTDPESAGETIKKWMFVRPLDAVHDCRDVTLVDTISELMARGKRVCIYSDYETSDKVEAVGLPADIPQYHCGMDGIKTMKPNPSGLFYIMGEYPDILRSKCVVVGDRKDRDGAAAEAAGVDHIILDRFRITRKRRY